MAQPCDLMVRKNGNRKQAVKEAVLAEVIDPPGGDKAELINQEAFYELLYFTEDGKKQVVSFQNRYSVNLSIIDLCAYQYDGSARLNVNDECPKHVIPTWQKHYLKLVEIAKRSIDEYRRIDDYCQKLPRQEAEQILSLVSHRLLALPALLPLNSEESLFTGRINLTDQSVCYELRRCGRLCQAHSTVLLAKFAAFLARAAFEHDFGGEKN